MRYRLLGLLTAAWLMMPMAASEAANPSVMRGVADEAPVSVVRDGLTLHGTLTLPPEVLSASQAPWPVALIIAGSGPTDRNGNNPAMVNNALQWLAHDLAEGGIASLRFDKRGIGESVGPGLEEANLRFEDYIADAVSWLSFLDDDPRFSERWVIGHSEGSLIGMVATRQAAADGFISLAGAGASADQILKRQLASQPEPYKGQMMMIIDQLVAGELVDEVDPLLASLFRPSVQPYLISWFRYNPANELAKLSVPVLIVQGSTDLQVSVDDANQLSAASPAATLVVIDGMNHVLKEAPLDRAANLATYRQGDQPLADGLVGQLIDFIHAPEESGADGE